MRHGGRGNGTLANTFPTVFPEVVHPSQLHAAQHARCVDEVSPVCQGGLCFGDRRVEAAHAAKYLATAVVDEVRLGMCRGCGSLLHELRINPEL